MSRIHDLISEHCPDGVDFKVLGEVGEFIRGRRFTKADYVDEGLGSIHYGEIYTDFGTSATETRSFVRPELKGSLRLARKGDLVLAATGENVEEVCKAVAWLGAEEVAVHDDCYIFRHSLDPKFVAYFFQSSAVLEQKTKFVTESKLARISGRNLAKIKMPVPPAAIQREIVAILDKMEHLQAELEAELDAELDYRTRQYAHYRKSLLTFDEDSDVAWSTIGGISVKVFSGGTPLSTRPEYYGGDIPWLRTQEVDYAEVIDTAVKITQQGLENSSAKWVRADSVIVAISGAGVTRGRVAINKIPLTTNQHCCNLEIDPLAANHRFVFYWLVQHYEDLRSRGQGNRSDLNVGIIKDYPIAVPPLEEQGRIVAILDKFDGLVNDLSVGLPAEIIARRQQYEHYRDKLLTFPERSA